MSRLVEPGSKLMLNSDMPQSAQAVRLFDPKRLQVRVDVPLADAGKVGVGMDARITVGVLPDRTFDGRVTRAVQEADVSKNTVQVKVSITDPAPELKPEMLARVRFLPPRAVATSGGNGTDAANSSAGGSQLVFAPEALIRRDGDESFAWVVDRRESTATRRAVRVGGARQDGWVSIVAGLNAGDALIAGDTSGIREGTRIRVVGELSGLPDAPATPAPAKGGSHGVH
jgi:multidrug efflux pump subunit AcrA (membrane-fusion protein)